MHHKCTAGFAWRLLRKTPTTVCIVSRRASGEPFIKFKGSYKINQHRAVQVVYGPTKQLPHFINILKPTGYLMHQQFNLLKPTGYVIHQQFNLLKHAAHVIH